MNSVAARMVFNNAMVAVDKVFGPGQSGNMKLTQGYLRLEQTIDITQTLYNFPMIINEGAMFNTERRLKLQDSFVCSELKAYVANPGDSILNANFLPITFASPFDLDSDANAAAIKTFWNGWLTVSVNNNVLVPYWDLNRHYYAPQTQQTDAFAAGSPLDEINGNEDGFYPMEPNIVFVGSKNIVVQIQLPRAIAAAPANSRLGLWFRGVLVQNSTVVS